MPVTTETRRIPELQTPIPQYTVNNYSNITQTYNGIGAAGDGIAAFNQGVGDITVIDGTLNNLGVQDQH